MTGQNPNPEIDIANYSKFRNEAVGVVPPVFRLGSEGLNEEYMVGEKRLLTWTAQGNEHEVAEIAGWSKLPHVYDEEINSFHILVPRGTRTAESVLSGTEAWAGEKASVVKRATDYLNKVWDTYGHEDTGFTWQTVAVTPDHEVFIAPPNLRHPSGDMWPEPDWREETVESLRTLLEHDADNLQLVDRLAEQLRRS